MTTSRTLISTILLLAVLAGCGSQEEGSSSIVLQEATIGELQAAIRSGDASCEEIVSGYLERIARYDSGAGINAITVTNPEAINRAKAIDEQLASGAPLPPLFCAPVLVKDNYDTRNMVTTGGSIALKDSVPPDDAFVVARLREAGAIVIAKTNMGEWAFSPRETVSSSFGRTANAYDIGYTPAGSSGGTASGVAASFGVAGLGSDTGNSIRGPSSHLGLFGIRPTIGLVSRDGVIPLLFDRDVVGPMTRTVEDGVRLFDVMAGHDPNDRLSEPGRREADYLRFLNADALKGKRIGVLRALVDHDDADPVILELFAAALADMEAAGAVIVDPVAIADFDALDEEIESCSSFRYDLYQYLQTLESPPLLDVNDVIASGQHSAQALGGLEYFSQFPLEVRPEDREEPCNTWPNHAKRNELLRNAVAAMDAAELDALAYPTWSNPPAPIDSAVDDYRGDNSQRLVPDAGLPAVTIPMGFWQNRLPAGLTLTGRPFDEGTLIGLAYAYEQATNHRRPPQGLD